MGKRNRSRRGKRNTSPSGQLTSARRGSARRPKPTNPLEELLTWVGHATMAWGLLPIAAVGLVTGALAWVLGWSAPLIILLGLAAAVLASGLIKVISRRAFAYAIMAVLLLGTTALAAWQADSFTIEPVDVRVGLFPLDPERTMASGVAVAVAFENPNDFPVWVMSDRRITTVGDQISDSDQSPRTARREAQSTFAISDQAISFDSPLPPTQITGGLVDYHLCYGRSKKTMTKSISFKARYWVEFHNDGIRAKFEPTQLVHGSCEGGAVADSD